MALHVMQSMLLGPEFLIKSEPLSFFFSLIPTLTRWGGFSLEFSISYGNEAAHLLDGGMYLFLGSLPLVHLLLCRQAQIIFVLPV